MHVTPTDRLVALLTSGGPVAAGFFFGMFNADTYFTFLGYTAMGLLVCVGLGVVPAIARLRERVYGIRDETAALPFKLNLPEFMGHPAR